MKNQTTFLRPTFWILGMVAVLATAAQAQQMNYQGRLTDNAGQPLVDGQYTLTFNIYTTATGGDPVWGPVVFDGGVGDGHAAKADLVNGRFNVVLGPLDTGGDNITAAFLNAGGSPRYLGITVGTDTANEIAPRQQILAAPEAIHAAEADHATTADEASYALTAGSANTATNFTSVVLFTDEVNERVGVGIDSPSVALDVAGDLKLSGNATFAGPIIANVDINTPSVSTGNLNADLVDANTIDANTITADSITVDSVNGEKPPLTYYVGHGGTDTTMWDEIQIDGSIIESYLGDENGGTIRFLLRVNNTDEVRTIDYHFYVEQVIKHADEAPEVINQNPGLRGWVTQGDNFASFILDTDTVNHWCNPWSWIWMSNFRLGNNSRLGLPAPGLDSLSYKDEDGPGQPGEGKFKVSFATVPNISATIIIYDR